MNTPHRWLLPILLLPGMTMSAGCHALSGFAHEVGNWLDPHVVDCSSQIPNCQLCGQPMDDCDASKAYPGSADGGCPHCQGLVPSPSGAAVGDPAGFQTQLAELRRESEQTRSLVDNMTSELAQRNQALIQSRADYTRMQTEMEGMRGEMKTWQHQVQDVHARMKQRDAERQAALAELTSSLSELVDEAK